MTRYGFRRVAGALFRADAEGLAALLPSGLRPLESHPGHGVLALTVFDFDESEVGCYRELVVSIVVPPWAPRGQRLPDAAHFPLVVATTTERARAHTTQRWKLPDLGHCLAIELDDSPDGVGVSVDDGPRPLLRLFVGTGPQVDAQLVHQCFCVEAERLHRFEIEILGQLFEHEDERGELELCDHPLAARLGGLIDDRVPFREQSMGRGEEFLATLVLHADPARHV